MNVSKLTIEIDGYENAAMYDDPIGETTRILRGICDSIEKYGIYNTNGRCLKDINGNTVGVVSVAYKNGE